MANCQLIQLNLVWYDTERNRYITQFLQKFSHAIAGVLYYKIRAGDKEVLFPIDINNKDDVGTTTFESSYRPITLMRYIRRAMNEGTLVEMKAINA